LLIIEVIDCVFSYFVSFKEPDIKQKLISNPTLTILRQ